MLIGNKYKLIDRIGKGNFGSIYKAQNVRTNELVAIKVESIARETKLLKRESQILQYLAGNDGFPDLKWFGLDERNYYMVMNLLGESLAAVKEHFNTLGIKETLLIGIQMIERIKILHEKLLVHRDIKPDNFIFGINNNKTKLFLIDFGFARRYTNDNGIHIPLRENCSLLGTPNFVSLNVHKGFEASRRDDLESAILIMIQLYMGDLPWENNDNNDNNDNNNIIKAKEEIIYDRDIPEILIDLLVHVRRLTFEEEPDYDFILESMYEEIEEINND
jgi:casein kinase 1